MIPAQPNSIDAYLIGFAEYMQEKPEQIRAAVKKVGLEAEEKILYASPAFRLHNARRVYLAALARIMK